MSEKRSQITVVRSQFIETAFGLFLLTVIRDLTTVNSKGVIHVDVYQ